MIDFDYLSKIRTMFALQTSKRTSNILEGDFSSVYRGRSLEFDELSEYTYGDNVQDIDWKSSSRTGRTLVRRYVAEKKHYILFVTDTGPKMLAHTSAGEQKADIAVTLFGTVAYLVDRCGADYAHLVSAGEGSDVGLFRSGMRHLDSLIHRYAEMIGEQGATDLPHLLDYAAENIRKKMIICVITDIDGVARIDENLMQKVSLNNDLLIANIDDAYLTDDYAFDTDTRRYADTYLIRSKKLRRAEHAQRREILERAWSVMKKNRVGFTTVSRESEVVDRVIALFDRNRD